MFSKRLSSYTFVDLDYMFKTHPNFKQIPLTERMQLYNQAQTYVMNNFNNVHQIHNSTIVDDELTYESAGEDTTILMVIGTEEENKLRMSLRTLRNVDDILKERKLIGDLSEEQRRMVYNSAQHAMGILLRELDDYQLVYDYAAPTYTIDSDLQITTGFIATIAEPNTEDQDLEVTTSWSYIIGDLIASLVFELGITTDFKTTVTDVFSGEENIDLLISTGFTTSVTGETIELFEEDNDLQVTTAFTHVIYGVVDEDHDLQITTAFETTVT